MTAFETYKFLHIAFAVVWVGGGILGTFFTERAKGAPPAHKLGIARDMEFVALRIFNPSAIAVLLFGILMVVTTDGIDFGQTWIVMGIAGIAVSAILGMAYFGPQVRKLVGQLESGDSGADTRLASIAWMARIDVIILVVVVWAMVTKPV